MNIDDCFEFNNGQRTINEENLRELLLSMALRIKDLEDGRTTPGKAETSDKGHGDGPHDSIEAGGEGPKAPRRRR